MLNDYGSANRAKILRVSMLFYRLSASAFSTLVCRSWSHRRVYGRSRPCRGDPRRVVSYLLLPFVSLLRGYFKEANGCCRRHFLKLENRHFGLGRFLFDVVARQSGFPYMTPVQGRPLALLSAALRRFHSRRVLGQA
ncbi:hypothetical protein PO124_26855 [Bacillus licheniformis]|nr:hypothetical protein [Bacillus licheniformis]